MLMQVLVSYSYFEKDAGQRDNFGFFILAGMGISAAGHDMPLETDFSIVISGHHCAPCGVLRGLVRERQSSVDGAAEIWKSSRIAVLHRSENLGMDFAAHNVRPSPRTPGCTKDCDSHAICL